MRKFITIAALAAATVASPAMAAVTLSSSTTVLGAPAGSTIIDNFDNVTTAFTSTGPAAPNTFTYVSSGPGYVVQSGSNTQGRSVNGTNYLSVLGGGSVTFSFLTGLGSIGFDLGSLDGFNSVVVLLSDNTSTTFTGAQLGTIGANNRVTLSGTNGSLITGLTFKSTTNALELDNMAAVPEPATWAMMLLGFGGIGFSMRRRRKTATGLMQIA